MTFSKDSAEQAILNGATIADLAAQNNMGWTETVRHLGLLGVKHPSAILDTPQDRLIAQYKGLVESGVARTSHEELVTDPDGALMGMPRNFSLSRIDFNDIFERFHGPQGYVDPYDGSNTNRRVIVVNSSEVKAGAPRNFLITNLETISDASIDSRFCKWMRPITETFTYTVGPPRQGDRRTISLTISRPYDKLVGGTYPQMFMDALVDRWVTQPLTSHSTVSPEKEPVFGPMMPFEMAWWAWQQLTHYGLLKGLIRLEVCDIQTNRTCVLRDDDVMNAIIGYAMSTQGGSPLIVSANQLPQSKFAPGRLLGN